MKMRDFVRGMILVIPLLFLSCNDVEHSSNVNKSRIICSISKFISDNPSRTNIDPNNSFSITWDSEDVIGIFPLEGYQEPFEIPASQANSISAIFDGGYWDVKDGLTYNAYYPFDKKNFDSAEMKERIPVSYIGQKQNGTSCDIGAFDYTYSKWTTATNGSVHFAFDHIGAIAVFSLKYPATTTYKAFTISVNENIIPLTGTYDLTDAKVANEVNSVDEVTFVADESSKSTSISLELTNCSGVAGEMGVFYMMLPPMDLSNNEVTLSLTSSAGTICTYSIEKVMNVKKGKLYQRTGIPKESKVEGTINGWEEETEEISIPYVTFTADAAQTFSMSQAVETLEYSVNGGEWTTLGTSVVDFGGELGELQLRGKSIMGTASSNSDYSYITFGNNVPVKSSGDIRTLIDYDNYGTVNTGEARFCYLFTNCSTLTTAPELPSKTLADKCYYSMFRTCSNLIEAPELPATTLADECYNFMFADCTNLKNAPKLPATILAKDCYSSMFQGCTSLITAPELPATTLIYGCYRWMFASCTSLETAPELPAKSLANNCYESMFSGCESLITTPKLSATTLADNCYENMFYNCTNLTTAPELPATTLTNACYSDMFMYCANLKNTPKLPATVLTKNCYSNMFYGCTSLATAPELPATTLAVNCYFGMFQNCTNLTTAPELPATTLAAGCYFGMFQYCTNLTTAPELPATTLTEMCYHSMFYGCSSLKSTPELPATTLADFCYWRMFYECSQLTNVTMLATDVSASSCLTSWLYGVSSTGTFTKAKEMNDLPEGTSGIPSGWTVKNYGETIDNTPYLTFSANSAQTFTMSQTVETLEYSVNGSEWTTLGTSVVDFGGEFGKLQLRGKSSIGTTSSQFYSSISFGNDIPVTCSGDLRTLVDYENYKTVDTSEAKFRYLFYNCPSLTTAPELPATTLANQCYYAMFAGCTNLTTAPELPATTLADNCYESMFQNCTGLLSAPNLPATILAEECYRCMFSWCSNLTTAPEILPATTLTEKCYIGMFIDCTSLTEAPQLPATTLANDCYNGMFAGCTSLATAPELPATTLANNCYEEMFADCTSLTTAPSLPATNLATYCYKSMFFRCTNLTTAPEILPATILTEECYNMMFLECTNLKSSPQLPASTLAPSCYELMFAYCENLNNLTMLATDISATNCLYDWVLGISPTGTFTKAASMNDLSEGISGIPSGWTIKNYGE